MIRSLLIANRGEIACRVIRTARAMGVRTVAVYSDADRRALHVRQADEAVPIGASPASESYLRGDRIIEAAKATGVEAIHPGYGFLSENADFARAVIAAGLVWVGPSPESIEAMGLKDAAKQLMRAAGVPVTPGYDGEDQSPERLQKEADSIGYPVLIKAVAGGGGKGMRKVDERQDFLAALESCKREAKSSFANDAVLLEKWITSPRHIEVQVFGDSHGNVVHLFERDCSLQRRHQKVIEEAPAPGMDPVTREAICAAAVRAAKAVDYVGAGTIEFIADASEGLRADRIFFMEMNTRLQVEHPVTEMITGVDLVEWQLRVASGEPLPKQQEKLHINGHAMEARLYAEDPARGFLPSIGTLEYFVLPRELRARQYIGERTGSREIAYYEGQLRLDTGYEEGDEVTPYYDPMIAKLIYHGDDRLTASLGLTAMVGAVESWPVKTNASFLHAASVEPDFVRGRVTTSFIDDHPDLAYDEGPSGHSLAQAAELFVSSDIPRGLRGFRLNAPNNKHVRLIADGEEFLGDLEFEPFEGADSFHFATRRDDAVFASCIGSTERIEIARSHGAGGASMHDGDILAPMPGKVITVDVTEGQPVETGQRLMVLEAMKMEHALTAPFAGTVTELAAHEGQQVQVEALLARVEKANP